MHAKFHGVASLLLESLAIVIGFIAIWQANRMAGGFYAALVLIAAVLMLYAYCAKCDIRLTDCRHVLPGQVTRLLPDRESAPYNVRDYLGLILSIVVLVAFPQPWLLDNIPLLIFFWACLITLPLEPPGRSAPSCADRKETKMFRTKME